jgi:hypothetical protein
MLSREDLSTIIINTPSEHILQTLYDICEFSSPEFNPRMHFKSTVFNCTTTTCHEEAYTTYILHIIKYYCSGTFCYMLYSTIYTHLTHMKSESVMSSSELNLVSIILMFRIIATFSTKFHSTSIGLYTPFDLDYSRGTHLHDIYNAFFSMISFTPPAKNLTLHTFNEIISNITKFNQPIVLKGTLNEGELNLHSFTFTILNKDYIIISGANGATKGICSVTQDNLIPLSKFQEYLHVLELIQHLKKNREPIHIIDELTERYIKLYNDIFLKDYIIRDVYTETGITMGQYCLIIIEIFNYIVNTYTTCSKPHKLLYIEYLESLSRLTREFRLYTEPVTDILVKFDYNRMLYDIIQKIPKTITLIKTTMNPSSLKKKKKEKEEEDIDVDDVLTEDSNNIFQLMLEKYTSTSIFENRSMHPGILGTIQLILQQEGISEYFLINRMAIEHKGSVEKHAKFKEDQLKLNEYTTNIYINVFGIALPCQRGIKLALWYKYIDSSPLLRMYWELGKIFIDRSPETESEPLMAAQFALIDILNMYCLPLSEEGYNEPVMEYIHNFVNDNVGITFTQFKVYHPLQGMLRPGYVHPPPPRLLQPQPSLLPPPPPRLLPPPPPSLLPPPPLPYIHNPILRQPKIINKSINKVTKKFNIKHLLLNNSTTTTDYISNRTRSKSKKISARTRSSSKQLSTRKYHIKIPKFSKSNKPF